ncbi:unnamed protein product, partial [Chrysoparadoxa australica]
GGDRAPCPSLAQASRSLTAREDTRDLVLHAIYQASNVERASESSKQQQAGKAWCMFKYRRQWYIGAITPVSSGGAPPSDSALERLVRVHFPGQSFLGDITVSDHDPRLRDLAMDTRVHEWTCEDDIMMKGSTPLA